MVLNLFYDSPKFQSPTVIELPSKYSLGLTYSLDFD